MIHCTENHCYGYLIRKIICGNEQTILNCEPQHDTKDISSIDKSSVIVLKRRIMKALQVLVCFIFLLKQICGLPEELLYEHKVAHAVQLPKEDDVSSAEIKLKVPIIFYGTKFNTIFVSNHLMVKYINASSQKFV